MVTDKSFCESMAIEIISKQLQAVQYFLYNAQRTQLYATSDPSSCRDFHCVSVQDLHPPVGYIQPRIVIFEFHLIYYVKIRNSFKSYYAEATIARMSSTNSRELLKRGTLFWPPSFPLLFIQL